MPHATVPRDRRDLQIAVALFVLALVPYVYFYGGWGANQEVNFALTRAVVEARTFQIDKFTVYEGDISLGEGNHIYSNKPPGLSAVSAVPYAGIFAAHRLHLIAFDDYWRTNKQLVTIAVCGVGGALIPAVLFLGGRRRFKVSRLEAAIASLAMAFGTLLFPYSTVLFAHVPSAVLLLLAFVLLDDHPLLAGVCAALSGACFLFAIFAAAVLTLLAWRTSRRAALRFIAGGVPVAILLAIYQWICFGSPLITPMQRSLNFTEKNLFLGVFGRPEMAKLWGLTFSEYRGLFYCSPVLLFAFVGAVTMIARRRERAALAAIGAISILFLLSNSAFNGWHGGAAFGPRYLIAFVPLLGFPMMFAAQRLRVLWLAVGVLALAINLAATAVDPMPLDGFTHPLTRYIAPTLFGRALEGDARAYLFPDCHRQPCSGQVAVPPDAGNLGERLLGKGRNVTAIPPIVWIVAGCALILRKAARFDRETASN